MQVRSKRLGSHSNPTAQAVLLVDRAFRDQMSGVFVLAGVFGTIFTDKLPARLPHGSTLFLSLANIRKGMKFPLLLISPSGKSIAKNVLTVTETPSSGVRDMIVRMPADALLETFGKYFIKIEYAGTVIGSRQFYVRPFKSKRRDEEE